MSTLPTVIVFGGTGPTGESIVNGLSESKAFNVVVPTRPSSISKPNIEAFRAKGASVVPIEISSATHDQLKELMKGADTVISVLVYTQLQLQRKLVDAAKEAGIKRFIPCDFGTTGKRGWRELYDEKLGIRDYVKESGIGYTFVDVGFWYQVNLPMISPKQTPYPFAFEPSRYFYGDGNTKTACIDLGDIGRFVARIIADPRTLNHYVFAWGEELTQKELFDCARELGDPNFQFIPKSAEDLEQLLSNTDIPITLWQYHKNMWVLGENTVENAKKEEFGGALDARELYPDLKVKTLREVAPAYYAPYKV
ncbi:NAD-P-binding protein [Stereum hirsutum FP-91666 SS1]|uniref:NAD-P-binding protein n=1 Tax=Stereum hirsutum (strain FP-91666) TaxID=721885 RepID=UPI000444A2CD|nr:NAD-P-binding protein [Stereum hirsutum FP-91666 SS1]EIM83074.1 NAD-P-binding protein [Stereum hirsutum FP-91666 SS1]